MKNIAVFSVFFILTIVIFRHLFHSYFEADEWLHFTHYLPLTKNPFGIFIALARSITDTNDLSAGQHIDPIGEEIFFLNTKLFGIHFAPYALISIIVHSLNSFFVFIFIKGLLSKNHKRIVKNLTQSNLFAWIGGIFFAVSAIPSQAVTWAAFYGQNSLSITFFLICLIYFQTYCNTNKKSFLVLSSLFLLLDLLTKETAAVLFLILPLMILLEKKINLWKTVSKVFAFPIGIFLAFRFILPEILNWQTQKTVTSPIHTNGHLPLLIYRAATFPITMISQVYFSSQTIQDIMHIITPIIYYQYPEEPQSRYQNRMFFLYGPGNQMLLYLFSFLILVSAIFLARKYYQSQRKQEAKTLLIGFFIIIISALPLVLNFPILPAWGTDYFDSRHVYMPSVGGAILFPFLLYAFAEFVSRIMSRVTFGKNISLGIFLICFSIWLINDFTLLQANIKNAADVIGFPRKEFIEQMTKIMPRLSQRTVFFVQTDGLGPYGPNVPFATSFPQILSVVYYQKSPLPDNFYDTFILNGKPEGYQMKNGRGFGFFASRKTLADALNTHQFTLNDIHGFFFDSQTLKISDMTPHIRQEMQNYLKQRPQLNDWKKMQIDVPDQTISFHYPATAQLTDMPIATNAAASVLKNMEINDQSYSLDIHVTQISPTFDLNETTNIFSQAKNNESSVAKEVKFDQFHYNDVIVATSDANPVYFVKLNNQLISAEASNMQDGANETIEKIVGSIEATAK